MHLKSYLLCCIVTILTISCTQQTSTQETSANTQVQPDSAIIETVAVTETPVEEESPEPDEPPIETSALAAPQFDFFTQTITGDALEDSTSNALARLIRKFL